MRPVVLEYIQEEDKDTTYDPCDPCDQDKDILNKNLQKNSGKTEDRSFRSHRSQNIIEEDERPTLYSCYHKGCDYRTEDIRDYERHGGKKHTRNPLLYPSKAELKKYGLKAQGKDWEI